MRITAALITIMLVTTVTAFGVSTFYYEGRPLQMGSGESKEIQFLLQNMVGDKDYKARAEITEGREIARIIGENTYEVPLGTKDTRVRVMVEIPRRAEKNYTIVLEVTATPKNEEQITIAQGLGAIVPVEITKKSSKQAWIITTIIVILLSSIIYIAVRKHLKKRKNYNY